jgi:hypothetical protein
LTAVLQVATLSENGREGGMSRIEMIETRKRGFFGWLFLIIFWAFNALMAVWMFSYWSALSKVTTASDAEHVGAVIGGSIGTGVILFCWVAGAVIFGLFALLTRGKRRLVSRTID